MPKRERDLRLHIMITHEELAAIQERMAEVNSQNQSAFIRKMAVDGYAVNVDLAPVKELLSLQRRSVNNLFQMLSMQRLIMPINLNYGISTRLRRTMETVFKSLGTHCKTGCTLGLRAKLARSQIRNERQRNDATQPDLGRLPNKQV